MQGSGDGGVTAALSAAISSPSRGFLSFNSLECTAPVTGAQYCLIHYHRDLKGASANTGF